MNYKTFLKILILIILNAISILSMAAQSTEPHLKIMTEKINCTDSGECSLSLGDGYPHILEACDSESALLEWNENKADTYLLTCDCRCTSHDNSGWTVKLQRPPEKTLVQRIELGKVSKIQAMREKPTLINDLINHHPLCSTIDDAMLNASVFISLAKQATNDKSIPYCFSVIYITDKYGILQAEQIKADGKKEKNNTTKETNHKVLRAIADTINKVQSNQIDFNPF